MTNRDAFVAALAQTLAPKLFEASGDEPENMGFPIEDSEEAFNVRMRRQFDPVQYWTERATEIAEGIATAAEAGGVDLSLFDYDSAVEAFRAMRTDLQDAAS